MKNLFVKIILLLFPFILIKINRCKINFIYNENYFAIILKKFIIIIISIYIMVIKNKYINRYITINIASFFSLIILSNSRKINLVSEITITIKGTGTQQILSNYTDYCSYNKVNFKTLPDKILVNMIEQEIGKFVYNLENEYNNITMIWNNELTDCNGMFYRLSNITNIDFTNFDGSNLVDIRCMFGECSSLSYLDLSNFNTSNIKDMDSLFDGCEKLTSLIIDNFDTSKVTLMYSMFGGCNSLKSLNISHFDTSKVTNMGHMFFYCASLTSLKLDNFDTSNVNTFVGFVEGCISLTSLDLSNFDTSKCEIMYAMFFNCHSLIYLDLGNFVTSTANNMQQMFDSCYNLVSLDISNFDTKNVVNMKGMFNDCKSLISLNLYNFDTSKLETYTDMFTNINNNFIYCTNEETQSNIVSLLSDYNNNDCSNYCFSNKNSKFIIETNKCIDECKNDEVYRYEYNNFCYNVCPSGTISSESNEFLCEIGSLEITSTAYIIDSTINDVNDTNTNIVIYKNISTAYINIINNECSAINLFDNTCNLNSSESYIKSSDDIINIIKSGIKDHSLDILISKIIEENNEDLTIKDKDVIFQLTSSSIQNNKKFDNISIIKLGDCEDKLREKNNISANDTLLIFKLDIEKEGSLIPLVEYEVYNIKSKTKLNLDICNHTTIDIFLPVSNVENDLFKHNSSSEYYNDLCFTYTTDTETDIILSDRKKEFINNNLTLCDGDCEYKGYEMDIKMSKCECGPKNEIQKISSITLDKKSLLSKFADIKNIMNLKVMKCYSLLLSNGLLKNAGNYIILAIILINVASIFIFILKGFKKIRNIIYDIIKYKQNNRNKNIKKKNTNNIYFKNSSNNLINKNINTINNQIILKGRKKGGGFKNKNKKYLVINNPSHRNKNKTKIKHNKKHRAKIYKRKVENLLVTSLTKLKKKNEYNLQSLNENKHRKTNNAIENGIMKYNDQELNSLNYKEALKIDKRTYLQYYFSLIKRKQKIIFIFFLKNDYNSKIIKISLFFFCFALYYTVNALFFIDSTMHKIYEDEGSYNFLYQIPQMLYSTIISSSVNFLINLLALSERNIISLKRRKIAVDTKIIYYLKIKFILYFALTLVFLILFWYYLSCFCAVYKNTQIYLIKDTFISFGFSLLYPLATSLLPGIFRIPALKSQKQDKKYLYIISQIIQIV